MIKNELRVIYKEKRRKVSAGEMDRLNDLILIQFQKLKLPPLNCVHTYLASLKLGEVDTANIIRYLQFKNPELRIAVPKLHLPTDKMQHFFLDQNVQLVPNRFGIDEPMDGTIIKSEEIDLVLVPLLAFDKKGFRVGYGKGYYDKFLAECRKDVITIGLSFFEAEDSIDDINSMDMPLDYCVTPHRFYHF